MHIPSHAVQPTQTSHRLSAIASLGENGRLREHGFGRRLNGHFRGRIIESWAVGPDGRGSVLRGLLEVSGTVGEGHGGCRERVRPERGVVVCRHYFIILLESVTPKRTSFA